SVRISCYLFSKILASAQEKVSGAHRRIEYSKFQDSIIKISTKALKPFGQVTECVWNRIFYLSLSFYDFLTQSLGDRFTKRSKRPLHNVVNNMIWRVIASGCTSFAFVSKEINRA